MTRGRRVAGSVATRPVALGIDHDPSGFDCGSIAQTLWLQRYALVAQNAHTARVYVATLSGTASVLGYHALAAGSVNPSDATPRLRHGTGLHPIPIVVLARLAVDRTAQGRGLGSSLLFDALWRVLQASEIIGIRALLVHCESEAARDFCEHLQIGFESSPTDPLHLVLLLKDLDAAVRSMHPEASR